MKKFSAQEREEQVSHLCKGSIYSFLGWKNSYTDKNSEMYLKCDLHGVQTIKFSSFLFKNVRCTVCSKRKKWTKQERENQIKDKYPHYRFNGWDVEYENAHSKVKMDCKLHGEWKVSLHNLLNGGYGCPSCGDMQMKLKRKTPIAKLLKKIEKVCKILNFQFVRFLSEYENINSLIVLKCKTHGEFQIPLIKFLHRHHGCPSCATHGFNPSKRGTLYALRSDCGRYVKVGITNKFKQRFSQLRTATPFDVSVIERIECEGKTAMQFEKMFHTEFESAGFTGFDGATEWLRWSTEIQHWLRLLK